MQWGFDEFAKFTFSGTFFMSFKNSDKGLKLKTDVTKNKRFLKIKK